MIKTPYYLIDKQKLLNNLEIVQHIQKNAGIKLLLALKCFSAWGVFDILSQYMDGTTSSSLYEVMLGRKKFGGETHAYNVAYKDCEIDVVLAHCDTIIFNNISQLNKFKEKAQKSKKISDYALTHPYLILILFLPIQIALLVASEKRTKTK